jgi:sulfatase maturation enzyme AslB (radical SAM superfamily)
MQRQFKIRMGPDGILLFNRDTGINILIDEIKIPQKLWASAPRHVSIALTNACDLDCPHCFTPKYPAKLDVKRLFTWLNELDASGCIGVGFGGGEPTLYHELPNVCRYAAQNTDLAVTFTTHGHHIDNRLAAALKGNVHFIRVSMDGVGATYEKIRKRRFASLLNRFELIRDIAPFGINYLVNKLTLPDLDAAVTVATEYGASELLLIPEQPVRGREGIDRQTMQKLREWVNSYQGGIPISISEVASEGFPVCTAFRHETGLRAYAHIDATGVIKRSSFDENGVTIGPEGVLHALNMLEHL